MMVRMDLKFVLPTSFSRAVKPTLLPSTALAWENKSELSAQPTSALTGQKPQNTWINTSQARWSI